MENTRAMFIVELKWPWQQVREELVTVVGKKLLWAKRRNGRRHLIGTSAFQSLIAADRARIALCLKIATDPFCKEYRYYSWNECVKILKSKDISCTLMNRKKTHK